MILDGLVEALAMLTSLDTGVWGPIGLSVGLAATSTALASVLGLPLGLWMGLARFRGRGAVLTVLRSLLALPTVFVGLVVFAFLSRQGPLGGLELLYTPAAIVAGQTLLAVPITAALAAAAVQRTDPRVRLAILGLGGGVLDVGRAVASHSRAALVAAVATAFGRVFSEVGVSMMVGGNIRGFTRTITTGIAFETGKGELATGIALGVVLLTVALGISLLAGLLREEQS